MTSTESRVAAMTLVLLALGGCKEDPGLSSELTRPRGGYQAPSPGCLPYVNEEYALLPMPYNRRMETYLPPGSDVARLALDYEVWPLAHVDTLRFEDRSDPLEQLTDVVTQTTCPRTVEVADLLLGGGAQQVHAVRVHAGDERRTRTASVYLAVGDRTLTVNLPEERTGTGWYLVFEPQWGSARIALAPAEGRGPTWTFRGLPHGPARVSIVQTPSVGLQRGFGTLHAPEGFAGAWPEYITGWYAANVTSAQEVVDLRPLLPAESTPAFAILSPDAAAVWSETHMHTIVDAASGSGGRLEVPCGVSIRAIATGLGSVELSSAGEQHTVAADSEVSLTNGCSAGSWTIDLETHPALGRSLDLILSEAP